MRIVRGIRKYDCELPLDFRRFINEYSSNGAMAMEIESNRRHGPRSKHDTKWSERMNRMVGSVASETTTTSSLIYYDLFW